MPIARATNGESFALLSDSAKIEVNLKLDIRLIEADQGASPDSDYRPEVGGRLETGPPVCSLLPPGSRMASSCTVTATQPKPHLSHHGRDWVTPNYSGRVNSLFLIHCMGPLRWEGTFPAALFVSDLIWESLLFSASINSSGIFGFPSTMRLTASRSSRLQQKIRSAIALSVLAAPTRTIA